MGSLLVLPHLTVAADLPDHGIGAAATALDNQANQAEALLLHVAAARQSEQLRRPDGPGLDEIMQLSRASAESRCAFLFTTLKANNVQAPEPTVKTCVAGLRLQNIASIAQYAELSLEPLAPAQGVEAFCKLDPADQAVLCPEPTSDLNFSEHARSMNDNLRDQVRQRMGVFKNGNDVQEQEVADAYELARSQFDTLLDESCRFAIEMRVHPTPSWAEDRCVSHQLDYSIYISLFFLSQAQPH